MRKKVCLLLLLAMLLALALSGCRGNELPEPHAIAVIGAKYDKKSVVFRIAFDTEMNLIGLDVRGK